MDSPGHARVNANGMDGEMRQLKVRRRRRRRSRRRRASRVVCVRVSRLSRAESQRLTRRRRVGVASEPGRAFKSRTWVEK